MLFIILTPVLFGTSNLDERAASVPLEMFVSLIGIILITPVFQPEMNPQVEEITDSKAVSSIFTYTIRIIYSVIVTVTFIGLFVMYMKMSGSSVNISMFYGTCATSLFLGSLGLIASAVLRNIPVSYMIPMIYYIANFSGGKKLGNFYLFSMRTGNFEPKIYLIVSSLILIILSMVIKHIYKKCR